MTDFARHVACIGETILTVGSVGDLLAFWLRDHDNFRTVHIIVPDVATATVTDGVHTVEADMVALENSKREGVRILITGRTVGDGWKVDRVDLHAPIRGSIDTIEQALDHVLDADADHPLGRLVAGIVEALPATTFAAACRPDFHGIVGRITIDADASTMAGTAASWTIAVRIIIDTDEGKRDHYVTVAGGLSLGVTRLDSIVAA